MRHVASAILFAVVATLAVPTVATAGDAPWEPRDAEPGQLLTFERFDAPPLAFPWKQTSSQRLPRDGRTDFELTYDVDYQVVADRIREAYDETERFIELEPGAMRYVDIDDKLLMRGIQIGDDGGRITVGHPDMESRFIVDIEPAGSQTRFVILNQIRSRQFSGFVPVRVGFAPVGADIIPLRQD